jgi:very-short-patch-repair endonuclease
MVATQGFVVLRFWNHDVLTQIDAVKEVIWNALKETPSFVLPRVRGRTHMRIVHP